MKRFCTTILLGALAHSSLEFAQSSQEDSVTTIELSEESSKVVYTNTIPGKYWHDYKITLKEGVVLAQWDWPGPPPMIDGRPDPAAVNERLIRYNLKNKAISFKNKTYYDEWIEGRIRHPDRGGDIDLYVENFDRLIEYVDNAARYPFAPNPEIEGLADSLKYLRDALPAPQRNLIENAGFDLNHQDWLLYVFWQEANANYSISYKTELDIDIPDGGNADWNVQVIQENLALNQYQLYRLSFDAAASIPRLMRVSIEKDSPNWDIYGLNRSHIAIDGGMEHHVYYFYANATVTDARLVFHLGNQQRSHVYLDNIELAKVNR